MRKHKTTTTKTSCFLHLSGNAEEEKIFDQQPVIQVMVIGQDKPVENLKSTIFITVKPKTIINMAEFSGSHRVQVIGSLASFHDLSFSNYGRGFVLQFETSTGLNVCLCFNTIFCKALIILKVQELLFMKPLAVSNDVPERIDDIAFKKKQMNSG